MKFHNTKKGFVGSLAMIIIVVALSGGGVYMYQKQKAKTDVSGNYEYPATSTSNVESEVSTSAKLTPPDTSVKIVPELVTASTTVEIKSETRVAASGNSLNVTSGGKVIQTIMLNEEGVAAKTFGEADTFKTNQDVNFDGHNDIGVLSGVGYGGVNIFYDYYLYNSTTGMYDKSKSLESVNLVKIDATKKELINSYKSGPGYESQTIQWNGSAYVKSEAKSEF